MKIDAEIWNTWVMTAHDRRTRHYATIYIMKVLILRVVWCGIGKASV